MELVVNGLTLSHHGIKGQKWGVRNAEWYPISAYRKHMTNQLKELNEKVGIIGADQKYKDETKTSREKAGIVTVDKNHSVIKKGSEIHRLANDTDKIDSRRKYVSVTENDSDTYKEYFKVLGIDLEKPVSEFTYEAKKSIKVADNEYEIEDYIFNTWGDKKAKDVYVTMKEVGWYTPQKEHMNQLSKEDQIKYEKVKTFGGFSNAKANYFIKTAMREHVDDISKEFIKRGYDAILDIEDYGFAEYPVILLDPSSSIKLKNKTKFGGS